MDHKQVLSNMQTSMNLGNTSDNSLGGLVIVSALITEFALAEILFAEAEKIKTATYANEVNVNDLANLDHSVAAVLDQVCCIERRIVEKIDRGITLRDCAETM